MDKESIFREVQERVEKDPKRPGEHLSASCLFYAVHGVQVLRREGLRALLQAGSLAWPRIRPEQDDGKTATHFQYKWSPQEAPSMIAQIQGLMLEVHVWVGIPDTGELVDFSTGFLPEQAKKLGRFDWPGDLPPKFFWGTPEDLPDRVYYEPDVKAIQYVLYTAAKVYGPQFVKENLL